MGMYTEIYINTNLKENTPQDVIDVLKAMCEFDGDAECLKDKPARWAYMFANGSFYTPNTSCALLTKHIGLGEFWSLLAKGDIKNYEDEIEQFFDWIRPYCEEGFIGYSRYEECWSPKLEFAGTNDGSWL